MHEAHRQGLIVNLPPERQIQDYKGGYVQTPTPQVVTSYEEKGQKFAATHACLDFKSLYPSLMCQFVLCFSHFVGGIPYERLVDAYKIVSLTEQGEKLLKRAQRIEGCLVESIEKARFVQVEKNRKLLEDITKELVAFYQEAFDIASERLQDHYFYTVAEENLEHANELQDTKELEVPLDLHLPCFRNKEGGILPTLIGRYMNMRLDYKKKMKGAYKKAQQSEDPDEKARWMTEHAHWNSAQLAVKVMVNSLYGFTGVRPPKAQLPLVALAAYTTCAGRWSIKESQKISICNHSINVDYKDITLKVNVSFDSIDLM